MHHYEHPRFDWLNEQMCKIADVVFSGIPDPNGYLAGLSNGDQCVFYIGKLISQVGNGGIHEYVSGPYADDIDRAIHYLREVGSEAVGDSLNKLKAYLPECYLPLDRDGRDAELFKVCCVEGVDGLDDLVSVDIGLINLDSVYSYCTKDENLG